MTSTVKLRAFFDRLRSYNITPEITLRKGIIMQAIFDACNAGQHRKDKAIRIEARTWLFGDSEDFKEVCLEAELDPKFIVSVAKEEIKARESLTKLVKSKSLNKKPRKKFLDADICAIVKKYIYLT